MVDPIPQFKDKRKEYVFSVLSLNCGIGSTNFDGDDFGFQISNGNVTFSAAGSGKFAFPAVSTTNGLNIITVVATQLNFVQQPVTTGVSQVMAPASGAKRPRPEWSEEKERSLPIDPPQSANTNKPSHRGKIQF